MLLDNGQVKCMGQTSGGGLGYGGIGNVGDETADMGNNLGNVNLGTGRMATALFGGGNVNFCVLLDTGSLKCWGGDIYGQLGTGDVKTRGDDSGEMGDSLPVTNLGTGRTAISIGIRDNAICIQLDHGQIKCFGYQGASNELGYGDNARRGDQAAEVGDDVPNLSLGTSRTVAAAGPAWRWICTPVRDLIRVRGDAGVIEVHRGTGQQAAA